MLRQSRVRWPLGLTLAAAGLASLALVLPSVGGSPESRPALIGSKVIPWEEAPARKADWGQMRTYFQGETLGTRDVFTAVAVVEPGKAVHRAHRHAEEEYLIINEGSGTWQLGDKTFPAKKSDVLYVEPWVFHGLTNTGDTPLTFTVIKFNSKGVDIPPRPDNGKDEL